MDRSVQFLLNQVSPIPCSLRQNPSIDLPASTTSINLGSLFLHHYSDSYPAAPPNRDPSRFEYTNLVSSTPDFRLQSFVSSASTVKKRAISTELGQAFCRQMLDSHFNVTYFAHMADVLGKPEHSAFEGIRIRRSQAGDVPDYLCAQKTPQEPLIAEAKGRFTPISFLSNEFHAWRKQFDRIIVLDQTDQLKRVKGYIVATRLATEGSRNPACVYIEDPQTSGEENLPVSSYAPLHRVTAAIHYSRVFRKLDVLPVSAALQNGFSLARELLFNITVWTCLIPPFEGVEFIGGFYRTLEGRLPELTNKGWVLGTELGTGHAVFVGLLRDAAIAVGRAARGDWSALDRIPSLNPVGATTSEFSWLPDGTVAAPLTYFLPTDIQTL